MNKYIFEGYRFVLASGSPRRRELLAGLGVKMVVAEKFGCDESYPPDMEREKVAEYLSRKKAQAYPCAVGMNEILITADTVVLVNDMLLGKPADKNEAIKMLSLLSGKKHSVITGVTVVFQGTAYSFSETSHVKFKKLEREEIDYYVDNYRPYDKAGAYAVQEWIGFIGIENIEGSYYNIMGLPVQRLYSFIKELPGQNRFDR